MNQVASTSLRNGYCIFIDTWVDGPCPLIRDQNGYVVFETELEAQKEIVDHQLTRLHEFLDGEREYEDAITVQEYVCPVTIHPDGTVVDEAGNYFDAKAD